MILRGRWRCREAAPPEDVGSVAGYYEFLEAVTTPRHRERKWMLEWYGRPYDPDEIDALIIRRTPPGGIPPRAAALQAEGCAGPGK